MNRSRGLVACLALAALVGAAFVVPSAGAVDPGRRAAAKTRAEARKVSLGSGVSFTTVTKSAIPLRYYVISLAPQKAGTVDVAMAGNVFGSYAKLSSIAGNRNALAGINGDFSDNGMPVHPFAEDGNLISGGLNKGASFSVARDKADAYLDNLNISATGLNTRTSNSFDVDEWNSGQPTGAEVSAFTPTGGSRQKAPGSGVCAAKLVADGPYRFGGGNVGLVRDYTVDKNVCGSPPPVAGGLLLTAKRDTSAANNVIEPMRVASTVRLTWRVADWRKTMDVIGGAPLLVQNGRKVADDGCDWYFCDRNPRSGVGIKADGTVLLIAVDGRSSSSKGVTPEGFAQIFLDLNARYAVNLDGGGGATMWVRGRGVVNRPSDGGERPLTNAILVLPGSDASEPNPARVAHSLVSDRRAAAAEHAAMTDPASTGGLLDALGG
ncbi:MAG: phosphodiester glycosidase family protein [Actinomycetota bacterium]